MIHSVQRRCAVAVILIALIGATVMAQQETPAKPTAENTAKAEAIVNRAIEVLGGNAYLNVKTVVGRGFFTSFNDGVSQIPARFLDYISFPDRERTEFTGDGVRVIQANTGDTGWVFDGVDKDCLKLSSIICKLSLRIS